MCNIAKYRFISQDAGVILDKLKRLQDLYDNPAEEAAETETHLQDILTEATVEIKPV